MITITKIDKFNNTLTMMALSTDIKPIEKVEFKGVTYTVTDGSIFYEKDTQIASMYDEENRIWIEQQGVQNMDIVTLALAKKYSNIVGSTITGTSYDYDTSKLTFNTVDGDWTVRVDNGMNSIYKQTLDNVTYDTVNDALKVNGVEVLTKEDEATGDLDFGNMFP